MGTTSVSICILLLGVIIAITAQQEFVPEEYSNNLWSIEDETIDDINGADIEAQFDNDWDDLEDPLDWLSNVIEPNSDDLLPPNEDDRDITDENTPINRTPYEESEEYDDTEEPYESYGDNFDDDWDESTEESMFGDTEEESDYDITEDEDDTDEDMFDDDLEISNNDDESSEENHGRHHGKKVVHMNRGRKRNHHKRKNGHKKVSKKRWPKRRNRGKPKRGGFGNPHGAKVQVPHPPVTGRWHRVWNKLNQSKPAMAGRWASFYNRASTQRYWHRVKDQLAKRRNQQHPIHRTSVDPNGGLRSNYTQQNNTYQNYNWNVRNQTYHNISYNWHQNNSYQWYPRNHTHHNHSHHWHPRNHTHHNHSHHWHPRNHTHHNHSHHWHPRNHTHHNHSHHWHPRNHTHHNHSHHWHPRNHTHHNHSHHWHPRKHTHHNHSHHWHPRNHTHHWQYQGRKQMFRKRWLEDKVTHVCSYLSSPRHARYMNFIARKQRQRGATARRDYRMDFITQMSFCCQESFEIRLQCFGNLTRARIDEYCSDTQMPFRPWKPGQQPRAIRKIKPKCCLAEGEARYNCFNRTHRLQQYQDKPMKQPVHQEIVKESDDIHASRSIQAGQKRPVTLKQKIRNKCCNQGTKFGVKVQGQDQIVDVCNKMSRKMGRKAKKYRFVCHIAFGKCCITEARKDSYQMEEILLRPVDSETEMDLDALEEYDAMED